MSTTLNNLSNRTTHAAANTAMYLSSFVGRKVELRQLESLILERGARLVTLIGPSGVGKTRTALHAAERLSAQFDNNAWLVELGPVDDPALVGVTIARAIGVPSPTSGQPEETIAAFVGKRRALIVLDNFEHVVDAAPLIAKLLVTCPNLYAIATSQTVLRLSGEHSLVIGPLPTPAESESRLHSLETVDAITLFLERARAVRDDFGKSEADAPSIAAIVRRLDGIPLALEIAASRANVLTPQSLLFRLNEGLLDFSENSRDRPKRQQTLRAAISWSYGFLTDREKTVFRKLSVFRGGFGLEAAEAVTGLDSSHDFLDTLSVLVDRSLVRRLASGMPDERFSILSAPWEFGREQLDLAGDCESVCRSHFDWYLRLAERSETELLGPAQAEWTAILSSEQGNFRAALTWIIAQHEADNSLALASALWRFWAARGNLAEAQSWLTQALELPGPQPAKLKSKALHHLANIALDLGDFDCARSAFEESHALVIESGGDPIMLARAFNGLGLVNYFQAAYPAAADFHERALEIRKKHNDRTGIGNSLTNLGDVALAVGDLPTARQYHEEALRVRQRQENENGVGYSLFNLGAVAFYEGNFERAGKSLADAQRFIDQTGDPVGSGYVLHFLGKVALEQGQYVESARYLRQALDVRTSIGSAPWIVECLEEVAALAATRGMEGEAAELFAAATLQREQRSVPMAPVETSRFTGKVAEVRDSIGAAAFDDLELSGRMLSLTQATEIATSLLTRLSKSQLGGASQPASLLSPREVEVLQLAARGLTDQEIADSLFMSRRTATTHQANIRQKLGVQNRAEAVALASREGII